MYHYAQLISKMNLKQLLPVLCLAVSSAALPDCYPDATGEFLVEGTLRDCVWAASDSTETCKSDVVAWQCSVTCKVPCKQPAGGAVIAGATEFPESEGNGTPVGLIVGCVIAGIAALALIAIVAMKKDNTKYDEQSRQSSLGLNDNGDILLSMSGNGIPDAEALGRHDSIATQDVQKKGTFDSCCAPC